MKSDNPMVSEFCMFYGYFGDGILDKLPLHLKIAYMITADKKYPRI